MHTLVQSEPSSWVTTSCLPPAVMLLGIAALTYLFGTIAIIFAVPVAVFAAAKLRYVRDRSARKPS